MYFANSYWEFFTLRLLAGIGFGMATPTLSALISEKAPAEISGRMVVLLDSFGTYGWIFSTLVSLFYTSPLWRVYYLASLLCLLLFTPQ